ncbi:MAG: hypothetical protein INR65_16000 [Gluconacetobacter diazotrophicus]|nr:hypothetical protein [Gluconacetobacter diazotrophicus]
MNLRVAASVAAGQGYGFRYGTWFPFPAQTDGPFVLPAAAVFRVFGVGFASAQAVSVGYVLLLAAACAWLLRLGGSGASGAMLGTAAVLALPGMRDFATGGYGEVPVLGWIVLALCCGMRGSGRAGSEWSMLAGLSLGIAAITKAAALLAVAPVLAVMLGVLVRAGRWRAAVALAAAAAVPVLGWEGFRCWSLGGTAEWSDWWRLQLGQVGQQSGAAAARWDPEGGLRRLRTHGGILAEQVGAGRAVLGGFLLLPWGSAVWMIARRRCPAGCRMAAAALAAASACSFGWWLCLAPDGMLWLRRILPGLALQALLVGLLVSRAGGGLAVRGLLAVPVAALALMAMRGASGPGIDEMLRRRTELTSVVAAVRTLPAEAVLFGAGWWQAPVVALFSERKLQNLDRWDPARVAALFDAFLVTDRYSDAIAGTPTVLTGDVAELRPVVQTPEAALWRIAAFDPSRPMRVGPTGPAFDAATTAQAPGAGWYPSAGGWAWARPDSELLLLRKSERSLVIEAAFWDELFPGGRKLPLLVSSPGCLERTVEIPASGARRIVLPLACSPEPGGVPFRLRLAVVRTMPVPPQLDADTRVRSFEVRRVALEPAAAGG